MLVRRIHDPMPEAQRGTLASSGGCVAGYELLLSVEEFRALRRLLGEHVGATGWAQRTPEQARLCRELVAAHIDLEE